MILAEHPIDVLRVYDVTAQYCSSIVLLLTHQMLFSSFPQCALVLAFSAFPNLALSPDTLTCQSDKPLHSTT